MVFECAAHNAALKSCLKLPPHKRQVTHPLVFPPRSITIPVWLHRPIVLGDFHEVEQRQPASIPGPSLNLPTISESDAEPSHQIFQ